MDIRTLTAIPITALLTSTEISYLSESSNMTWGDTAHTLVTKVQFLGNVERYVFPYLSNGRKAELVARLDALFCTIPENVFIDLEN